MTACDALQTIAVLAASTFISEDLTGIAAGVLVSSGRAPFGVAVAGCFVGIVIGDFGLFMVGRFARHVGVGQHWLTRWVRPASVERSRLWIETRGAQVILASRFLPGTRVATYVASGLLGMSPRLFAGYLVLAAALWTPVLIAASAVPSSGLARSGVLPAGPLAMVACLFAGVATLRLGRWCHSYRVRRAIVGWWRRWTRWEFWPMWLFYPPIVLYVLWLGVKYRRFTLFTACNPGLPAGGFVGESKSDILRRVQAAADVVPAFVAIPGDAPLPHRLAAARSHAATHGYPVVVKPDQGQRGAGVVIARTPDQLMRAVELCRADLILQRYVPGEEFGIFYYRFPDEARGHIFAITEKRLATVVGDGRRTLEHLILDDPRAVAIAPIYLGLNRSRVAWIPPEGTGVQLSELGVHSRGAIFVDGERLRTRALEDATDRIGRSVSGFAFGRFDVRADSIDAFRAGQFSVIELNGVTSEATSIYDPSHSLMDAYRTLCAQWRLAFAIGAAQCARGVDTTTVSALCALARAYRVTARGHLSLLPL